MSGWQYDDAVSTILRVVRASGLGREIDEVLAGRPGPKNPLSADAVFVGIGLLAFREIPYQHKRLHFELHCLSEQMWRLLGLPMVRDENGRWTLAVSLDQVQRKMARIREVIVEKLPGGMDRFVSDMLWVSLPDRIRKSRSILVDGTFINVHRKRMKHHELDAVGCDTRYQNRNKKNSEGELTTEFKGPGYSSIWINSFDPTDLCVTPFILSVALRTGSAGEPTTGLVALNRLGRRIPVLDTVVVDQGFSVSTTFRAQVHSMHGDIVSQLSSDQQTKFEVHRSGATLTAGRVFSPGTNLDLIRRDEDGNDILPISPPKHKDGTSDEQYRAEIAVFFDTWEQIDRFACRPNSGADANGARRYKLENPNLPHLGTAGQQTVTIRREDFPHDSCQPFGGFGTPAHHAVLTAGRSRNEGGIARPRERGLQGGKGNIHLRGLEPFTILATIYSMITNLVYARTLAGPAGPSKNTGTSKRRHPPSAQTMAKIRREVKLRHEAREALKIVPDVAPLPVVVPDPP